MGRYSLRRGLAKVVKPGLSCPLVREAHSKKEKPEGRGPLAFVVLSAD
jgi:hypothetical protein